VTTEIDWVRQARQGNAEAWESIVLEHQQAVFRLAYLLLGDADEAEDVAQETFIRAFRALDGFDAQRPLRPWLLRIATNLAYNWRRSTGRYLLALQRLLYHEPAPPSLRQRTEQRLEAETLWEAIRKLTLPDQQVIYLRYFLESSENEAAEVLRVPTGTVKSRLHRALGRLRVILQEEYSETMQEGIHGW
jgi:RNA polymerase sigma-70 factor (ECF subfamily)